MPAHMCIIRAGASEGWCARVCSVFLVCAVVCVCCCCGGGQFFYLVQV